MFAALSKFKVIPHVKVKDLTVDDAVNVAEALAEGGLPVMELMFRRHSDSMAIKAIATKIPEFWIGAGGILNKDQLLRAMDAKARFGIAPGINIETLKEANRRNIMFAPGACTPSDIENIILNGFVDFQFFPAEQSGGVKRLKAILDPFDHLPLDVFAKGDIGPEKIREYLEIPQVTAVSVDWVAKCEYIEAKNWKKITESAKEAKRMADEIEM